MVKIGNVEIKHKTVLAPMAGIGNSSFRKIIKQMGCGLIYAEMVSDKAISYGSKKTIDMLYMEDNERPIAQQIFGSDKESFVAAAKYIYEVMKPDIIDINMGCPVPKVAVRAQAGSALLKNPEKIREIVSAVVESVPIPVTVKIRSGWDSEHINAIEVAKICEEAGASAICVHPRTRSQGYSGKADWNIIKQVKEAVKIPVIGNGDIIDIYSAKKMLDETRCDLIMIGRGDDKSKRFTFGIRAMTFIIKEILDSKMNILSNNDKILDELIQSLELKNFVSIVGYQKNPEHYLRNSSLHIFPSICDTYPMVLSETKIFGIPTILCGLDYLALAKKGTIIIHDNDPYILAKESIKILKDKNYRKKLGFEARQSMQKIKNKFIIKKWIKLLLAIYNDNYNSSMFKNFEDNHIQITEKQANIILNYQLKLFQKIDDNLKDLTLEKLKSYSLK